MRKINDNGIVRDATAEEIAMFEARKADPDLTDAELLDILLGGGS